MNRQAIVVGAIALAIVALAIGGILYSTRNNQIQLTGTLLRVRTHPIDNANTIVLADIRVTNPTTQRFVVKDVRVFVDDMAGDMFADADAQRLFDYYPVLGKKYNPNLMIRQQLKAGESIDRMVTVRIPNTEQRIQDRRAIRIVITDVDGAKTEIVEKRS